MLATLQTFTPYSNIMNYSLEVDVSVITSFAFISIYQIARHHKNQVYDQAQLENQTNQMRQLARATKLVINALYIFVILLICYTPSLCRWTSEEYTSTFIQTTIQVFIHITSPLPFQISECLNKCSPFFVNVLSPAPTNNA